MLPTIIRRASPRTPADWISLIVASGAGVGVNVTDDWLSTAFALVAFIAGVAYRFAPDDDNDGVPNIIESIRRVGPTAIFVIASAAGIAGCSHWHATMQRAAIEASAAGSIEYLNEHGIEGSGQFDASASATLEVCRAKRCVPLTVTVETADSGQHVTVCASAWRITMCEVVP